MTRVRLRGIYTTALTSAFDDAGFEVVQASAPIERRFDDAFPLREHDVAVDTTADRQGVAVTGDPDGVQTVVDTLRDLAIDTFVWDEVAARSAVYDARVDRTVGGGAILALPDDRVAYLPFSAVDDHVTEGDVLRVQMHDPTPPWSRDNPVADAQVAAFGGVATLVRGTDSLVAGTPGGSRGQELANMTELLADRVPDGWGVRWERPALDASLDALGDALDEMRERATAFDDALDTPVAGDDLPAVVARPEATTWVWFGREARFALDEVRREVVPTMVGHHRIKAAHAQASAAVDFVERLGASVDSFPFDAVTRQFGPEEGDELAIEHGKPEGRLVTLGRGEVVGRDPTTNTVTLRREMTAGGTYDALGVPREAGDVAVTKFKEGRWWYPTVYRDADGATKGTYVNVSTPVEVFPSAVRYVDLHVDVIKHADGSVETVDQDELREAVARGHVAEPLAEKALDVAARVDRAIR